jgi:hypothetical protein
MVALNFQSPSTPAYIPSALRGNWGIGVKRPKVSQIVVVTQRANGGKLIQAYTLDQGAGHMIVSTQITGGAP